jgi:hypothetical protein
MNVPDACVKDGAARVVPSHVDEVVVRGARRGEVAEEAREHVDGAYALGGVVHSALGGGTVGTNTLMSQHLNHFLNEDGGDADVVDGEDYADGGGADQGEHVDEQQ